jgi:hypothetical protein
MDYDYMRAWQRAECNGTSIADEWDRSWTGAELAEFNSDDPDQVEIMRDVIEIDARTDRDVRVKQLQRRNKALCARLEEIDPDFDPDEVI